LSRRTALFRPSFFARWLLGIVRHLKPTAITPWSQTRYPLEQSAEECRLLIAHLPANFVHGCLGPLQPALGLLNPKALDVGNRAHTRCLREAPLESPFCQTRSLDHLLQ